MSNYKSDAKGELIPTVIIQFHNMADYWMAKDQYNELGGFRGFLKSHEISIREIVKVHHVLKNPKNYPTGIWEG